MGTPDFAIPSLQILVENGYDVVGVITAPDRPAGRGKQLRPSPVKVYAETQGLHVLQPEKFRNPEFLAALSALQADLAVVVAFRMLPEVVWSLPRIGTLNLHAALLPDYRGAAPINWVIINGESRTGATTFMIDKKIDTGAMLLQQTIEIPDSWNAGDLHDALMVSGAALVLQTVKALEKGQVKPIPQDHGAFLHPAPKIFKDDCRIDVTLSARRVHNLVRGLSPYPVAWTRLNGKVLKVFATQFAEAVTPGRAGSLQVEGKRLFLHCGDAVLEILELQLEGKKRMKTAVFLQGYKGELNHVE